MDAGTTLESGMEAASPSLVNGYASKKRKHETQSGSSKKPKSSVVENGNVEQANVTSGVEIRKGDTVEDSSTAQCSSHSERNVRNYKVQEVQSTAASHDKQNEEDLHEIDPSFSVETPLVTNPDIDGIHQCQDKTVEAGPSEILEEQKLATEENSSNWIDNDGDLVMLPDDVLLIVLSYLDHYSLSQLRTTCTLFARLCDDYTLWRKVEFELQPATPNELEIISRNVHKETRSIRIRGSKILENEDEDVSHEWLASVFQTCPELEQLALPGHPIDCRSITLNAFPSTLTVLDLSNTQLMRLPEGRSYFRDISSLIPKLKVLILSNCPWFEPHSLMAISKCSSLEELRLNDCVQVKDCLAYCGLSTRGGFKTLKTLDLRRSAISNSELVCFSSVPSLKNLYLENVNQASVFIDPALIAMTAVHTLRGQNPLDEEYIHQRLKLERLAIRNYQLFSDGTLLKLAHDAYTLKYLDVTGSGCSIYAVERFRFKRPNVEVISSYHFDGTTDEDPSGSSSLLLHFVA